ncbi:MAG: hypothetical protein KC442_11230 [Thermomicrobiales bacterium]|nr:hypothetical protein [Thermomicrobiales bacterium]
MSESGSTALNARTQAVAAMSNDALIIDLLQTVNHLSRWITPIHDRTRLESTTRRAHVSVKELLLGLRDNEVAVYSLMHAIATQVNPDLDKIPTHERSLRQREADERANTLVVLAEFRRVRESTTSLLRALPDTAWARGGYSRNVRDWTIRQLAESLAVNDWQQLGRIDAALEESGTRHSIAQVSRVSRDELRQPFLAALENR